MVQAFNDAAERVIVVEYKGQSGRPKDGITRDQMARYFQRRDAALAADKIRYRDGSTARSFIDSLAAEGWTIDTTRRSLVLDDCIQPLRGRDVWRYAQVVYNVGDLARNY